MSINKYFGDSTYNRSDEHRYDDIIEHPRHRSQVHPPMPLSDRAAQFGSFAPLSGHKKAIWETARLTEARPELDENQKAILDEKMQQMAAQIEERKKICFTFFIPDLYKKGGTIADTVGAIKKIDVFRREIILENGTVLHMDDILQMEWAEMP